MPRLISLRRAECIVFLTIAQCCMLLIMMNWVFDHRLVADGDLTGWIVTYLSTSVCIALLLSSPIERKRGTYAWLGLAIFPIASVVVVLMLPEPTTVRGFAVMKRIEGSGHD